MRQVAVVRFPEGQPRAWQIVSRSSLACERQHASTRLLLLTGGKAASLLHDLRSAKSSGTALQLLPPGKCPTAILRHPARTRRIAETFGQCLLRHGKVISKRNVTKCVCPGSGMRSGMGLIPVFGAVAGAWVGHEPGEVLRAC